MLFILISIVVPIVVFLEVPSLLTRFGARRKGNIALLAAACVIFFISWYVPSPLIHGQDTSAATHFVGGGVFSGLLWLYAKGRFGWKADGLVELLSLFSLVSALGVANELFELLTVELHLTNLSLTDTNWDLLANTLGALLVFIAYRMIMYVKRKPQPN